MISGDTMIQEKDERWLAELTEVGIAEGQIRERHTLICRMKAFGLSVGDIAEITGLPEEEVCNQIESTLETILFREKVKRWKSEVKAAAYAEGKIEGQRTLLRRMKEFGISIGKITEISGLPEEEICNLIQSTPGNTVIQEKVKGWIADLKAAGHAKGYSDGYSEMQLKERRTLLLKMKAYGMSISEIAEVTGLSEEEIRHLI
jgi:predicted transposase YdaD